jgi:hypothetical protein
LADRAEPSSEQLEEAGPGKEGGASTRIADREAEEGTVAFEEPDHFFNDVIALDEGLVHRQRGDARIRQCERSARVHLTRDHPDLCVHALYPEEA